MTIMETIIEDIFNHNRTFLPGHPNTAQEVRRNMTGRVNIDGLSDEERFLLLSILPQNADQLWVSPLDKGLSGSKVFSVRYSDRSTRLSKPFVCKIGKLIKIDQEADATHRFAAPYLHGIESPIYRRGHSLGLLGQELRGLSANVAPESLRLFMRHTEDGLEVVNRLFSERLEPWYSRIDNAKPMGVADLMADYLAKGPARVASILPEGWEDLTEWTEQVTGSSWNLVEEVVPAIISGNVISPKSIIHGDLHTQNVLVDPRSRECWPIDFAWCRESSPLVDVAMLECSLKFLAFPMRSDLRSLLAVESTLSAEPSPDVTLGHVPYFHEIGRIIKGIILLRRFVIDILDVPFSEYRKILLTLTYSLSPHEGLNRPYIISSLQILAGAMR